MYTLQCIRLRLHRFINATLEVLKRSEIDELGHLVGVSYKDLDFKEGDSAGKAYIYSMPHMVV